MISVIIIYEFNLSHILLFGLCFGRRYLQTPLPEQEGSTDGIEMDLEALGTKELAFHITLFDWDLFWAVHEYELLYHTFGRHHFGKVSTEHSATLRSNAKKLCNSIKNGELREEEIIEI